MKKYLLTATVMIGALLFAACGNTNKEADKKEDLTIVTTFYPIYDFTKEIVGDEGNVKLLIPAGTEPHDFEPSAKERAEISDADVFVYNSSDMEFFVDSLKDSVDSKQTLMIEAAKGIDRLESQEADEHEESEEGHNHAHEYDPHVWLDPVLAIKEVRTIAGELGEKYPDKKEIFTKNADAYIKKLEALDQKYSEELKNATNRTFVTQHAAFAYLANQYNLEQVAISGVSPDQEPTPSRLAELKEFVKKNNIKVIYFEENASSKVAETLSNETGVKLEVLNPLESLTNEQIKAGENYISVMEKNLEALKESIN
ncbi:zinc ABC transporter substrate-binding protein [Enterococcus faecium]|uniref:Zinc ABC transporter substrate-binding protein n=1 Tax=Enterococcus faecium TaxID=1352 RepID=A0AB74CZW4_ENTFC|nr:MULTISPECIES: metal ABC transporter substrate-binding protein [Enterococcus]EGP4987684.1 zinc ABC transporter substrate-binding protein [Enterococcus faecium]EGP5256032.1 zinc ABC transporter substrate-binding protein [Enterococcus faecium]EME7079910.1 zinc ABC transporter substrate-binding protein [Enterococcus faecium]EME7143175.1 zinc ABC transporter substrate-binding protein [Enterococcus faecium]EME8158648.1 zinc ABC transporter substrate-binding protein [Enterococcus faecium]